MNLLLAAFVVVVFAVTIERLELPARAREVAARAGDSLEVLRDPTLDDEAKERALRHQSGQLFRLLGLLAGGSLLALGLPLAAVWLLELAGVASLGGVLSTLERPDFLLGTVVVGAVAFLFLRALRRP